MDKKILLFIKSHIILIWIIVVSLVLSCLLVMAAYPTKQNRAKKVIALQSESEIQFSSNYLEKSIIYKTVVLNNDDPIIVDIKNNSRNNSTKWYPSDISFTLTAALTDSSGTTITNDTLIGNSKVKVYRVVTAVVEGEETTSEQLLFELDSTNPTQSVSQILAHSVSEATVESYKIYFPSASSKVCVKLTATPDNTFTDLRTIGAVLAVSDKSSVQGDGWTGMFNDPTSKSPVDYDAFNYVIAGHGDSDSATIQWDSSVITLNKMYIKNNFNNLDITRDALDVEGKANWKQITIPISDEKSNNGMYSFQIFKAVDGTDTFNTFIAQKHTEWNSAMSGKDEDDEGYISEAQYLWQELQKCIIFDDGI